MIPKASPTLRALNEALLAELLRALALPPNRLLQAMLRLLFGRGTERFAELALGLDREIREHGPGAGARWLLPHLVAGYEARGVERIPREGPLLIVANHPASYDALVLSAFIDRTDYKILIGEIRPYRYLPHIRRHAIFAPPTADAAGRMQAVRDAIQHLKDGGALLMFPRGAIEPDPACMPDPDAEFDRWSRSLEILTRRVPTTRVLVAIVSGVIAPAALRHPLTRFRAARPDRQRLAYSLQIIQQAWSGRERFGLQPRVTFGEPLSGAHLAAVEQAARQTLCQHLATWGISR